MRKILLICTMALAVTLFAQDSDSDTGMGIGLSNQVIDGQNYQSIALMPELDLGFFGVGLNVDLRFKLDITQNADGDASAKFAIYEDDWIIEDGDFQDYLSLYLTKIAYIRLGHKDEDFYMKAGQFTGATLGNGTILSDYSNTQFLPETKVFGLALDMDGNLFDFPYLGFESFIGNLAAMDVVGGRLYVRPFVSLEIPVVSNIEIGATGVMDRDPYFYSDDTETASGDEVLIYGADLTIPFIDSAAFTMDVYGDIVFQKESSAQVYGLGGKLISLVDYKLEYINQQENYIAQYFNAAYDLNRTGANYDVYMGNVDSDTEIPAKQDLGATLGFEIPNILYFDATLDGLLTLFGEEPDATAVEAPYLYPSLKASLVLDNESLKMFGAEFFYLKTGIDTFESIVDPTNAIIGGVLNYYQGSMVVSFIVDVKYNSDVAETSSDPNEIWTTNTQLAVNFQL